MLENGANPDEVDHTLLTPLHIAAQNGQTKCAALLLDHGGKLDSMDETEKTPLMFASENGYVEMANLLIQKGADLHAFDQQGRTCIHWASLSGHLPVVSLLIANDVLLYQKDVTGRTALHLAVCFSKLDVISFLVKNGAGLNLKDYQGFTSLHWASFLGIYEAVELLLGLGANPNTLDSLDGKSTPLDYANLKQFKTISALLQSKGGMTSIILQRTGAIKIQKIWRGHHVRKNAFRKSKKVVLPPLQKSYRGLRQVQAAQVRPMSNTIYIPSVIATPISKPEQKVVVNETSMASIELDYFNEMRQKQD